MANRFYGYDIIKKLVSMAEDATYGINARITEINTERSLTGDDACPIVKSVTTFWDRKNALPQAFIKVSGSEIQNADSTIGGAGDEVIGSSNAARFPDKTGEIYSFDVVISHKSNSVNMALYMELFAQAVYKVYHLYCDDDIEMILADVSIRDQINTEQNQTYKFTGFTFTLKIDIS